MGDWAVLTRRALTWKSLCVPRGEGEMYIGSLIFIPSLSRNEFCFSCCLFGRSILFVSPFAVVEILFFFCDTGFWFVLARQQATVCLGAVVMIVCIC